MKNLKVYKFPNGATLLYQRNKVCNATAVNAGFYAGHYYHNNIPGLPHFVEHMLFQGTHKRSREQFIEDRSNITLINAHTTLQYLATTFYESNKRIEKCFEFSSDMLLNTKLDESKLENEKKVVFEEKARAIDSSNKNIRVLHFRFLEKEHFDEDKFFGSPEILGKVTIQDVQNFIDEHFVSDKFFISVVSSLPFNKIKSLAKKYFIKNLKIPSTPSKIIKNKFYKLENEEGINIIKNKDNTLKVIISLKYNVENGLDYRYDYNFECISSRMHLRKDSFNNLARKNGCLYVSSNSNNYNGLSNVMTYDFSFTTSNIENMETIINLIGDNIKTFKKDYISQEEIDTFVENVIISKDKTLPTQYHSISSKNISLFDMYGNLKKHNTKQIIKDYKKINKADIEKNINLAFNKNNKVYITIMGDVNESEIKTLKEYKKMLFK